MGTPPYGARRRVTAGADPRDILRGREVLVEIEMVGNYARVVAVDGETGLEVVALGPATAARSDLERLAAGKLARRLSAHLENPDPPTKPGFKA